MNMEKQVTSIEKQLEDLESFHQKQVAKGRYYYWEAEDDVHARLWQERADETKDKILNFKREHGITTPNWWE